MINNTYRKFSFMFLTTVVLRSAELRFWACWQHRAAKEWRMVNSVVGVTDLNSVFSSCYKSFCDTWSYPMIFQSIGIWWPDGNMGMQTITGNPESKQEYKSTIQGDVVDQLEGMWWLCWLRLNQTGSIPASPTVSWEAAGIMALYQK
jgi:hypothetical protein